MMPMYDNALSTNTSQGPIAATNSPAIAGPIARDTFTATLLSAIAGCSSSAGTRSGTIADHAGIIMAEPRPRKKMKPSSSHAVIIPVSVSSPSTAVTTMR